VHAELGFQSSPDSSPVLVIVLPGAKVLRDWRIYCPLTESV